ncbi:CsbD family protein [Nocardia sp. NPDC050406]|uniref:CsbD family protein n=1 Tax=Nocardia sp. NPDC050406 TaxID=3364318 RepID=UPI0037A33BD8
MSLSDKISNKAEEFGGKAKEAAGDLGGDENLKAEGKADQASAGLKNAVEDIKDGIEDVVDKVKGKLNR